MKVKFIGYINIEGKIDVPWFTVGKEYEVVADRHCSHSLVWVVADDDVESPMFEGEFEIVSE